jgi:regulator of protease activity HflC (stomatin/prohibitin superfamily)
VEGVSQGHQNLKVHLIKVLIRGIQLKQKVQEEAKERLRKETTEEREKRRREEKRRRKGRSFNKYNFQIF